MYNLCRSEFDISIECIPSVHSDGHEPSNLISADARCRFKGFKTERFVKPPVQVALTFSYPICVQSILISPSPQRCSIEVWVCRDRPSDVDGEIDTAAPLASVKVEKDDRWFRSAQYDCIPGVLTRFRNPRFRDDANCVYGSFMCQHTPSELNCQVVDLKHGCFWVSAQGIAVRIVRVEGAAIPALQSLEIWGVISSRGCESKKRRKLAVCEQLQLENHSNLKDVSKKRKRESTDLDGEQIIARGQESDEVPVEFLDEITFEVMLQPVLLPSGHMVDAVTVEKHSKAEAIWSRPPSDPFTGLPYTTSSKPLPNSSLKARIDRFLCEHDYQVHASLGRRLGMSQIEQNNAGKPRTSILLGQGQQHKAHTVNTARQLFCNSAKIAKCALKESVYSKVSSSSLSSHSDRLQSSLEVGLQEVLCQQREVLEQTPDNRLLNCIQCSANCRQLLKLLCDHLICHDCWKSFSGCGRESECRNRQSEMECPKCKARCLRSEVLIVHSQSH